MKSFKIHMFSSLIVRSLISVFAMMVLVLGTAGYVDVKKLKKEMKDDVERDNLYIANITSEAINLSLWNLDSAQIEQQLRSLANADSFCGARVKDTKGVVFVNIDFPIELAKYQFTSSTNISFLNPNSADGKEESIGTLELCYDSEFLNKRLQSSIYNQLFFMGFLMFAVLAASYISMLIIFRPLLRIRTAMAHLSEKMEPISDVSLLKENEIGQLTKTFNTMVNDLSNTYKRLEIAKIAAEEANVAKSEFLSNMSHELRTPMHAILSYSDMGLKNLDKIDTSKLNKYFSNIQTSGKRLLHLVNALLDISQLESGEAEFCFTKSDIKEVIDHSRTEIESLIHKKGLKIIVDYKTDKTEVIFDRNKIIQVVINLLSNAIKFSPENSAITIVLEESKMMIKNVNKSVILASFQDEGPGIPAHELEKVFDKFVQSSKTKNGSGGTGLGLSICRQIIEGHEGLIWAEQGKDKGTVFKFVLPTDITITVSEE